MKQVSNSSVRKTENNPKPNTHEALRENLGRVLYVFIVGHYNKTTRDA